MPRMRFILLAAVVLLLAGCSRRVASLDLGTSVARTVDLAAVARGRAVFERPLIKQTPGCVTCHSLEPGVKIVGPSLAGVATRAASVFKSPEYHGAATNVPEFLRESVLTPQVYLSGGFAHSAMPEWEGVLDRQELEDLTAFLASLE